MEDSPEYGRVVVIPQKCYSNNAALYLVIVIVVIIIIILLIYKYNAYCAKNKQHQESYENDPVELHDEVYKYDEGARTLANGQKIDLSDGYPYSLAITAASPDVVNTNIMYSTAEVDPMITGQLYSRAVFSGEGHRYVYGGRVAMGDRWGMHEFSRGVPGTVGVDIGPLGLPEYGVSADRPHKVFDDGIPENWVMPSTPMNYYYVPQRMDYYSPEAGGPEVYKKNLVTLSEPDHDPLIGAGT